MSKVEDYIRRYTKHCSNELVSVQSKDGKKVISYHEWLTPDNAKCAAEIAMEEVIKKAVEFFDNDLCCYIKAQEFTIEHQRLEEDFKKYIEESV